jgi:tetratricopeptide (TPR) repeat protein
MNNRLPPAWSKHLRPQFAGNASSKSELAKPQPSKVGSSRSQADDLLLKQAYGLQQAKRFAEAQELCLRVLARTPRHPLASYIMGTLTVGFDDEMALRYFSRAAEEEPQNPYYRLSLGETYLKLTEYSFAIKHIKQALKLKPDLVDALCALGKAYIGFGKIDLAIPLYESALRINRDHPKVRTGLAGALMSLGRMDEAAVYLKEAIERGVTVPAAYNDYVETRTFAEEPVELQSILRELDSPRLDADGKQKLHQAAGKVLSDLRRFEGAMGHFKRAREALGNGFDIEQHRRWVNAMIETFSPGMLAARTGYGNPSEVPVFVVGMPRSGTTLVEQICASHPDVHGAGELSKLRRVANAIGLTDPAAGRLERSIGEITAERARKLADEHLAYLRERSSLAVRIVDKMPHNFELVGLIGLLFPNARIIHCRRDAIDNCVSCFVSGLNSDHRYNADLRTLGLYYREYDRLMRHWCDVFPGRIFENRYEMLVADQQTQSRRLIDFLGLHWDDACLRFFDKGGAVNTLSRRQVRQPIYASSLKRWRNYEAEIQPLIQSLGDLAEI